MCVPSPTIQEIVLPLQTMVTSHPQSSTSGPEADGDPKTNVNPEGEEDRQSGNEDDPQNNDAPPPPPPSPPL